VTWLHVVRQINSTQFIADCDFNGDFVSQRFMSSPSENTRLPYSQHVMCLVTHGDVIWQTQVFDFDVRESFMCSGVGVESGRCHLQSVNDTASRTSLSALPPTSPVVDYSASSEETSHGLFLLFSVHSLSPTLFCMSVCAKNICIFTHLCVLLTVCIILHILLT